MDSSPFSNKNNAFAALRRFARPRVEVEFCDLCRAEISAAHTHLLEPQSRKIHCACRACAILFDNPGDARFKRVPTRVSHLSEFKLTDEQWNDLMIPIQLAFFYKSSIDKKTIALYPGPAGATESLLPLEAWNEIVAENSVLQRMETEVEALLVNRVGATREYFIVPVDECYKLVGLIRTHWRGLSGGTEVWREINNFYADLSARAVEVKNA